MIDQVDALKARRITTLMFAYLFENKKKIADRRKKKTKKKRARDAKESDGNSLTSCLFSLPFLLRLHQKIVDVRLIVSLSESPH